MGDAVQYYYPLSPITAISMPLGRVYHVVSSPLCLGWCEQPGSECMHTWMNKECHHTLSTSFYTKKPTVMPSVSLRLPDIATIRWNVSMLLRTMCIVHSRNWYLFTVIYTWVWPLCTLSSLMLGHFVIVLSTLTFCINSGALLPDKDIASYLI